MPLRLSLVVVLLLASLVPGVAAQQKPAPELFGVVNFYSPRMMYLKYQPLVDYLGEHTGRQWELRISTSYQQTVEELCAGKLTAAYLGPWTYVRAHAACGAEPVLRLQTGGQETYRSYILVREDSPARKLTDLKGKRFGFGSALSTSSHLVPRAMLVEAGLDVGENVQCLYLEHHERAARAVLVGEVDACGIRDLAAEKFVGRGLRILARSDPIPNFPFVVTPDAPPEIRRECVRALAELPTENPAAADKMASWDEELAHGFVFSEDEEYDAVRDLAETLFGPGALTLPEARLRCAGPD
jgi:phosphonate transport system substrate-binding protein